MLALAREAAGVTQAELAKATGISQGKLSKYENGLLNMATEDVVALSERLGYTADFFYQSDRIYGLGSSSLFHRQRQSAPILVQRQIQARINILRMQVDRILRGVELETPYSIQPMDIDAFDGNAERIAGFARIAWQLPLGPVRDMTSAIENAGGIVLKCNFGTTKVDAAHLWIAGLPPLFFMNGNMPADRYRFTLAHELGHAIMHRSPTGDIEAEADRFASEFLMPAKEIGPQLAGLNIQRAASIKPHWRVSMAALVRRAKDLGMITERHYRTLFQRMSSLGYRTNEPVPIADENPQAFKHLVQAYASGHRYSQADMERLLFTTDADFFCWHGLSEPRRLKINSVAAKPPGEMRIG